VTTDFYVWYRVSGELGETERLVRGMMARLACRTGVAGRLLKKRDEPTLWMEVYTDVGAADAFARRLDQAVAEYDLEMFIDGTRRSECFLADTNLAPACAA